MARVERAKSAAQRMWGANVPQIAGLRGPAKRHKNEALVIAE